MASPFRFVESHHAKVESTQDIARAWLAQNDGQKDVLRWVRADTQTRGRGRQGRVWASDSQRFQQLLISCGFFAPDIPISSRPFVSLIAGAALYEAVIEKGTETCLQTIVLKWPNDLCCMNSSRQLSKLAGVLSESFPRTHSVVVGWGLNVNYIPALGESSESSTRRALSLRAIQGASKWPPTDDELSSLIEKSLKARFAAKLGEWFKAPSAFEKSLVQELESSAMKPLWGLTGEILGSGEMAVARGLASGGGLRVRCETPTHAENRVLVAGEFRFLE